MPITNALNNIQVSAINTVTFTSNGTYTPPANLLYAQVTSVAGGGGSGGSAATGSGQRGASSSGGGGATVMKTYAKSALLPNVVVTIGGGGAAGAAGQNNGSAGGTTTFLSLSAAGGGGGNAVAVGTSPFASGVLGGTASGGDVNVDGGTSSYASYNPNTFTINGPGNSLLSTSQAAGVGNTGKLYGGGGGGIWRDASQAAVAGNAGADGIVVIYEFLAEQ